MAIRDDDRPYAPRRAPSTRRASPERQRQIMARRLAALGVGIVILILIVLGVKGCLNARKTRSFENFVADLRSLSTQTTQLCCGQNGFLQQLSNPPSSKLDFTTNIETDAGTANSLLARAQTLSTPGDLSGAHGDIVLAYELRANALEGIATDLRSGGKSNDKVGSIISHMKQLLASDVLYGRARFEIDNTLVDQGIDEQAPKNVFLPNPQQWLRPSTIQSILAGVGVAGTASGSVSGVHGTGIVSATLDGATLTAGVAATVTSAPPNTLDISVANQGNSTEKNLRVSVKISGGGGTKTKTIPSIAAGGTETASVELGSPPTGSPLTISVNVAPVLGERITTNNRATYNVTFQ